MHFSCNCYFRDLYIGAPKFTKRDFWHFWLSNFLSKQFSLFQAFAQPYLFLLSLAPPLSYFLYFIYNHLPLHSILQGLLHSSSPLSPGILRFICLQRFLFLPQNPFTVSKKISNFNSQFFRRITSFLYLGAFFFLFTFKIERKIEK